jgi:hypothetical protein
VGGAGSGVGNVVAVEPVRPIGIVQHLRRLVDDHDAAEPTAAELIDGGPDALPTMDAPTRVTASSPRWSSSSPMSRP